LLLYYYIGEMQIYIFLHTSHMHAPLAELGKTFKPNTICTYTDR
jgi:hypothetical protein